MSLPIRSPATVRTIRVGGVFPIVNEQCLVKGFRLVFGNRRPLLTSPSSVIAKRHPSQPLGQQLPSTVRGPQVRQVWTRPRCYPGMSTFTAHALRSWANPRCLRSMRRFMTDGRRTHLISTTSYKLRALGLSLPDFFPQCPPTRQSPIPGSSSSVSTGPPVNTIQRSGTW